MTTPSTPSDNLRADWRIRCKNLYKLSDPLCNVSIVSSFQRFHPSDRPFSMIKSKISAPTPPPSTTGIVHLGDIEECRDVLLILLSLIISLLGYPASDPFTWHHPAAALFTPSPTTPKVLLNIIEDDRVESVNK